jgi:putative ABC transport system permease protein
MGSGGVVVSARLATNVFGTSDVVGRTLREPGRDGSRGTTFRVVGVVGDVHGERIEDGLVPTVYLPLLHDGGLLPDEGAGDEPRDVQYVMRGTQLPAASTLQQIVRELDPRVPATSVRTLGSIVDAATARVRLTMLLIGVAAAAALLLGVIGVYSVVSYAAAGRVREFGIRLALGAAPRRVRSMVLGDGLRVVAVGAAAGLLVAMSATKFLRSFLYEVKPTSLTEFAFATAALIIASLLAAALPARRAVRTDPAVVLRGD